MIVRKCTNASYLPFPVCFSSVSSHFTWQSTSRNLPHPVANLDRSFCWTGQWRNCSILNSLWIDNNPFSMRIHDKIQKRKLLISVKLQRLRKMFWKKIQWRLYSILKLLKIKATKSSRLLTSHVLEKHTNTMKKLSSLTFIWLPKAKISETLFSYS